MLLSATNLTKAHGVRRLFHGIVVSVAEGDRIGLIGPNGVGKTTLLRLLGELETPDEGEIRLQRGVRRALVPQDDRFADTTVESIVVDAARGSLGPHDDEHRADVVAAIVLDRLGFDRTHVDATAGTLSGGWRKRLSVACALAAAGGEPELLLLDEPTNHLDLAGIRWIEDLLRRPISAGGPRASISVTHDRVFLETVANRVIELSPAYATGMLDVPGNYSEFLRRKGEHLDGQVRAEQTLANEVRRDLTWLSRGAKARRTKAKGRITESAERSAELASLQQRNAAADAAGAGVGFVATGRRSRKLLHAIGVGGSIDGRTLFRDVDLELGPGDCVGILGPNGCGKTTLLRILTGDRPPDDGEVRRADPAPRTVVFHQARQELNPDRPLREILAPLGDEVRFGERSMHVTAWARRFLFREEQLFQPVGALSGGELARLHIARLMLQPADLLVLDEPTNDLDIPTLEILEESLAEFHGAVILVTHDRAMLDRLATTMLVLGSTSGETRTVSGLDQARRVEEQFESDSAVATAPPSTAPAPEQPRDAGGGRKKLSYKDQREFDGLESRILEAEERVEAVQARLNDPALAADHVAFAAACTELEEAQGLVEQLYARWAELEAKVT